MTNQDWVSSELDRVYPDPDSIRRQSITALMYTWSRMVTFGLKSPEERQDVLDAFCALVNRQSIPDNDRTHEAASSRVWAPANLYYKMSSIARVRPGFSAASDAWKFSAREGKIIGIRGGYMIIKFDNEIEGAPSEYRGRPSDLEVDISHIKKENNR